MKDRIGFARKNRVWRFTWQSNEWKNSRKEAVKNVDLWKKLIEYESLHDIRWFWVKGHSGNYYNELVNDLAVQETKSMV